MRKGSPEQLIAELENKISELRGRGVNSSSVIIEEEDTITAEEDIINPLSESEESIEPEIDYDEYFDKLYDDVERKIEDLVQDVAWHSDDENLYMDANFLDGHVITFTIPKADLIYDLENNDMDVEYICQSVRDAQDESMDKSENMYL